VCDWEAVLAAAASHGVHGVVWHHAVACGVRPHEQIAAMADRREISQALWVENLHAVLHDAAAALDVAEVRFAALKGPLLGERLYPSMLLRPSLDLDLLVAEADLERAVEALQEAGYTRADDADDAFIRKHLHHIRLEHRCGMSVELHFRAHADFGTVVPADELLERAVPFGTSRGARVLVLSPEDELLYLLVHAVGHVALQLGWLYDVKLLIENTPDLDWSTVVDRARAMRLRRVLAYGCEAASRGVGARIPSLPALRISRWRSALVDRVLARLIDLDALGPASTIGMVGSIALLCDRWDLSARVLGFKAWRIARQHTQRHLPSLVPPDWSA
jgi:hypothetical protein